uniref:Uncharacterized protein n=1 Tax=Nicotiana tabacum TaxID=4097 RepID=A0A1S4C4U8_TOBAC
MKTPVVEASPRENSMFEGYLAGVEEGPDIDTLLIFEEAEKLRQQSQVELARCEDEFRKLISKLGELKALHAQKEGELGDLRDQLERISQERADLDEKELRVRDTEILRLKQRKDEVSSDKETLREKLTSVECQLQGARGESLKYKDIHYEIVAELSAAKSEAAELMSSNRKDVDAANARARKISEEAELKLSDALENASDSTSGSEDDEDDGEVPEGEDAIDVPRVKGQAVEGTTSE